MTSRRGHDPSRRARADGADVSRRRDADRPAGLRGRDLPILQGRGASYNPPNRFERHYVEPDPQALEADTEAPLTELIDDPSRSIIATNDSPDVGFDASVNPYRGCSHGCVYCYARPTHEYLGYSAGLDFETKILVKRRAPEMLREALSRPSWKPRVVAMSGVTDPYQPAEARLGVTRGCLEVLRDFRNPVAIITKNRLVARDADVLADLASHGAAAVLVSITSLDRSLQRVLEPRTSTPSGRLETVRRLADAGIPVGVMVAPVIPGLTDHEAPSIVAAAAEAGALAAHWTMLRLPHGVKELFEDWLEAHFPDRRARVLHRIREVRDGRLSDAAFGRRQRGTGEYAGQVAALFAAAVRKAGLPGMPPLSAEAFRVPGGARQLGLFA